MHILKTLCTCLILSSCYSKPAQDRDSEQAVVVPVVDVKKYRTKPGETYDYWKQKATSIRAQLKKTYDSTTDNSTRQSVLLKAEKELVQTLTNSIIPFWYGTPWDFNGYTDVPGKGTIACGYFVSTTLLHAGLNLNRYTLAQQHGLNEAKSLCIEDSVVRLENVDIAGIYKAFEELKYRNGLYFVGLDFHVGYLLKADKNIFFLHSNYVAAQGVTIEPIEESEAFHSSAFYIVPITTNRSLVKKWVLNEPIKIFKE